MVNTQWILTRLPSTASGGSFAHLAMSRPKQVPQNTMNNMQKGTWTSFFPSNSMLRNTMFHPDPNNRGLLSHSKSLSAFQTWTTCTCGPCSSNLYSTRPTSKALRMFQTCSPGRTPTLDSLWMQSPSTPLWPPAICLVLVAVGNSS